MRQDLFENSTSNSAISYGEAMSAGVPAPSDQLCLDCALVSFASFGLQFKYGCRAWKGSGGSASALMFSFLFLMAEEAFPRLKSPNEG